MDGREHNEQLLKLDQWPAHHPRQPGDLIILTILIMSTIIVVDLTITLTSTVHQDCVVMRSNSGSLGQWAHVGCSKTDINFVCERKPTC